MSTAGQGFSFETYRAGSLRTVGTAFILPSDWPTLDDWQPHDAQAVARMLDSRLRDPAPAARGKMILLEADQLGHPADRNRCRCFQIRDSQATAVFCGNSVAALGGVSAHRGLLKDDHEIIAHFEVVGDGAAVTARTAAYQLPLGYKVTQSWSVTADMLRVSNDVIDGLEVVRCRLLNDYLLIDAPRLLSMKKLRQMLGRPLRLNEKVVVLDRNQNPPRAQFFTANGLHGAAPQTGLAILSILAHRIQWLGDALTDGVIETPAGVETVVPMASSSTWEILMPDVSVRVYPLTT
ncbi:hypothetical protein [Streptomyces sp. NPDC041003]|uniref:hypothetical protein n=1 Tax=Streptomyces sp. NPDC041003 TaxID=3155730 RepID=UPI0033FE2D68